MPSPWTMPADHNRYYLNITHPGGTSVVPERAAADYNRYYLNITHLPTAAAVLTPADHKPTSPQHHPQGAQDAITLDYAR